MAATRFGKRFWIAALLPTLLGFDFWTKDQVAQHLPVGGEITVIDGWVSILHAQNPFVAFSTPIPLPMIVAFGLIAVAVIAVTLWRLPNEARLQAAALSILGAGALGNLLDRIDDRMVTDFVKLYADHPSLKPWLIETFGTHVWPIFNVADVALLGGVGLYLVGSLVEPESEPPDEPEET